MKKKNQKDAIKLVKNPQFPDHSLKHNKIWGKHKFKGEMKRIRGSYNIINNPGSIIATKQKL